jgi:hypothetical protein
MSMSTAIRAMILFLAMLVQPAAAQTPGRSAPAGNLASEASGPNRTNPNGDRRTEMGSADWAIAELVRIDTQMRSTNRRLAQIEAADGARGRIEEATTTIAQLKGSPAVACGAPADVRAAFNNSLRQTLESLSFVSGNLPSLYPWEDLQESRLDTICGSEMQTLLQRIEAGVGRMGRDLETLVASREGLGRELSELETRKRTIITQMSDNVASARVTRTMPWILGAIFLFGIASMLGIRFFSAEIQSELIGTGQLVQFVTILILFGALLALGLADKLQEQTLAALLGGLAGYVLSQGIGQKERRSTLETVRQLVGPNNRLGPNSAPADGAAGNVQRDG